jgi:hypothetical protein
MTVENEQSVGASFEQQIYGRSLQDQLENSWIKLLNAMHDLKGEKTDG